MRHESVRGKLRGRVAGCIRSLGQNPQRPSTTRARGVGRDGLATARAAAARPREAGEWRLRSDDGRDLPRDRVAHGVGLRAERRPGPSRTVRVLLHRRVRPAVRRRESHADSARPLPPNGAPRLRARRHLRRAQNQVPQGAGGSSDACFRVGRRGGAASQRLVTRCSEAGAVVPAARHGDDSGHGSRRRTSVRDPADAGSRVRLRRRPLPLEPSRGHRASTTGAHVDLLARPYRGASRELDRLRRLRKSPIQSQLRLSGVRLAIGRRDDQSRGPRRRGGEERLGRRARPVLPGPPLGQVPPELPLRHRRRLRQTQRMDHLRRLRRAPLLRPLSARSASLRRDHRARDRRVRRSHAGTRTNCQL
mmetsp:Transcript_3033/g.9235  ORF Transcript_3033/g.9235 Transcript_3033/m.9235 type:complete len:363 (+) Transcript_3033:178-1266(+)